MTNYSRSVLKSNGLPRPKIWLKKFGFSSKSVPANIAKKLPPQCCSKPLFNFAHKWPTFAFTGKSGYPLGFRRRIAHNGARRNRSLPSPGHNVVLCCQRNRSNQLHLQPLIPPRFYIHTFPGSLCPHYQQLLYSKAVSGIVRAAEISYD